MGKRGGGAAPEMGLAPLVYLDDGQDGREGGVFLYSIDDRVGNEDDEQDVDTDGL